ncbi:MAG: cupin domain-containing protein [Lachnospiraceae bacterium]|nr:cupin domain-containing protein [Lachnospiraceae bacterium]
MYYILLSGGSGKRLWPLSNEARPKQYIRVVNKENNSMERCSMIQRVWEQLEGAHMADRTIVTAGTEQQELILSQVPGVRIAPEPERRNTFPAVLLSCAYLHSEMGAGLQDYAAVMPVDPYTEGAYFTAVQQLEQVIEESGAEVGLLGVEPGYPAVKYGYMVPKNPSGTVEGKTDGTGKKSYLEIQGFVEKPRESQARQLINQGALWNCGVFCVRIGDMLERARAYGAGTSYESIFEHYEKLPKISFDYEVLEKAKRLVAVKFQGFWKDLGTWDALAEQMSTDTIGKVILDETSRNTQVINELEIPVAVLGARDMVVVASQDGILVTDKSQTARVGEVAGELKARPMYEERRWGTLETLDDTEGGTVSTLTRKIRIYDGKTSSYHFHRERDEIWTVLSGRGELILEGNKILLTPGKAVCIRKNQRHAVKAIHNFEYIEIHVGKSTGNEDINRITFQWDEIELSHIL